MTVPSNLIPFRITQLPVDPSPSTSGILMYVRDGVTYQVTADQIVSVTGVPTTRQVIAGTGLTGGGQLLNNVTLSVAPGGIGSTQLDATGVSPGTYGGSTAIPVLTIDSTGRVTAASTSSFSVTGFVPTSRQVIAGTGLSGGGPLTGDVTINADLSNATPESVDTTGSAGVSTDMARADHKHPAIDLADDDQVDGLLGLANGGTARSLVPDAGAIVWSGADGMYIGPVGLTGQVLVSGGTGEYTWGTALVIAPVGANLVYAGPASGPNADSSFRSLVNADIPATLADKVIESATISNAQSLTAVSGNITNLTATTATISDLSATVGTVATLDGTSWTVTNFTATSATIDNFTFTSSTVTDLTATNLTATSATVTTLTSPSAGITTLSSSSGTITNLIATTASITDLSATIGRIDSGTVTQLTSTSGTVTTLTSDSSTITNLIATTASITDLSATIGRIGSATITDLVGTSASITTLTGTTLGYGSGNVTVLTSDSATLTNLVATSGTITTLTATSATVTNLGVTSLTVSSLSLTNATFTSATITTLTSTSAGITNLSLGSLVISSTVLVANLNADLLDGESGSYYLNLANATGTLSGGAY